MSSIQNGLKIYRYWTSVCGQCAIKAKCTPGKERRVTRWEHEVVIEKLQDRLDQRHEVMSIRRQTVEHPFGTIKAWMGAQHFKTKTLKHVSTDMSLHLLAYNIKRAISIFVAEGLLLKMQTA